MIIGNGDIAEALKPIDRDDLAFIASGLSNSRAVDSINYMRELQMINKYKDGHIVYFSSLCVYYSGHDNWNPNDRYAIYKRNIERYIRETCFLYTIVRLGNLTWGKNPHTLLNYLKAHPEAERRDEIRYLIDKEEFQHWMKLIRPGVCDIMNLTGKMINVKDL